MTVYADFWHIALEHYWGWWLLAAGVYGVVRPPVWLLAWGVRRLVRWRRSA